MAKRLVALTSVIAAMAMNVAVAHADGVTYTVEPFDYDSVAKMSSRSPRSNSGGSLCPCVKVPYPADGLHNDAGVAALANTPMHAGDTVVGFSLGSQVIPL